MARIQMMKNTRIYPVRCVVTGASSGIGKTIALALAKEGYEVFALSRKVEERTEAHGDGSITTLACDITRREDIIRAYERIGAFGILVNSAGFGIAGALENVPEEDEKRQFETNYFGTLTAVRLALPYLRRNSRSLVVAISSVAAEVPLAYQSHYAASKAALTSSLYALSMEVRKFNIHVSLIEPGDTRTEFTGRRKTFPDYNDLYPDQEAAIRQMEKDEENGKDPESVARVVKKILRRKNPPIKVVVGLDYKALMLLRRLLPEKGLLFLLRKIYHIC